MNTIAPPIQSAHYPSLQAEYANLFSICTINNVANVDPVVDTIESNKAIYQSVGIAPWYWIGAIHYMEADFDFTTHLYNGDPLSARTVDEPAGRPIAPPDLPNGHYSWAFSAKDSLTYQGLTSWTDWSIPGCLYQAESYNGWGYRLYHGIYSPYVWSGSQLYTTGKYASDGQFVITEVSEEVGVGVIIKRMQQRGLI